MPVLAEADADMPSPYLQRRIEQVQVFLQQNLHRDVDLQAIAQEAALSPYYFTRAFTAYVGMPPYRYLIQLRMQRAAEFLRDTELSVTQICQRVGFNGLSHFTTTFRRHTGQSPTSYRRSLDWQRNIGRFGPATEPLTHRPNRDQLY